MGFLALLAVYVREIFFASLAAFRVNIDATGSFMKLFFAAIAVICFAVFVYQIVFKQTVSSREIILLFSMCIFCLLFILLPRAFYGSATAIYNGQMFAGCSASLSAFLMGMLIRRTKKLNSMCTAIPIFIIIMTIISALVAFGANSMTSGGYLQDESGFNYQTLSYFISYTFAFNVFYIKNQQNIDNYSIFKKVGWNTFFQCLIPVHLLLQLIAGGRGAFVLTCILSVYYFAMDFKNVFKNIKNFVIGLILIILIIFFVKSINLQYSGFDRILGLLSGIGDNGRNQLRDQAIGIFKQSIIFGHGPGSVLYFMEVYSHNLFTDILVEYGAFGLSCSLIIIFAMIKRLYRLVHINPQNHLVALIYICGFTMLMFSGYYFSMPLVWFAAGYTFASEPSMQKASKYIKYGVRIQ